MAIIRSFGALQSVSNASPSWYGSSSGALNVYGTTQTYGALYRAQPNIRTVVDFIARNIAQLGIHVFRRISDQDRERLAGHELAGWLFHPNPATTRYRLMESTAIDLGIYLNAYWLKVRSNPLGLVRIPPEQMTVEGALLPTRFVWTPPQGTPAYFKPSEIVHFNGYNPDSALMGLSPLETLRRVLAEEYAAGMHRESYWRNGSRMEGVVTRPKEKPRYTPEQAQQWREQWQAMYGGQSGKTVLMQDGETFTPVSFSPKESEYIAARKLTREECAAAYHVPLPMVGILEHATFSNIKEQHKHLYQDCLGPWLVMIAEELERQLLIEADDQTNVYLEFNIAEKLKGSFEEQASSLQTLVGRPVMSVNEGRGRLNLRSTDDPEDDKVAKPLNMSGALPGVPPPVDDAEEEEAAAQVLETTTERITARLAKVPVSQQWAVFDADRWSRELVDDLTPIVGADRAVTMAADYLIATQRRLEADVHD